MSFQDRRHIVEQWIRELAEREKEAKEERESWQRALQELDTPANRTTGVPTQSNLETIVVERQRREPGRNSQIVQTILEDVGKPQPINFIARRLHEARLITSQKGYKGVYAIVSTILRRNAGKRFVHLDDGWWDLSKRHQPSPEPNFEDDEPLDNDRPDSDFYPEKIGVSVNLDAIGRN